MKLERTLHNITELIVRHCNPHEILLFGSYAKGQDNVASDLDILVIGDFSESPYLRGRDLQAELTLRHGIPIDLHLVTPEELAQELKHSYGFMASIVANSVTLYKKDKSGIDSSGTTHGKM